MVLNYIWIAFFLIAFCIATIRLVFMGDTEVFPAIINSTFDTSKTAFEISLGLTGVLSLWLGIMKIGEKGGVVNALARVLSPVFTKLFPDIPKGHPVTGSIFMNIAANMLGLDNAATPLGLRAMEQLQELNPKKDTATNPMIMFLVLNTSGLTLIPVSIMVYRAQMGAAQPTDIFVPLLLATFFSTLAGIVVTSIYQRINLVNRTMLLTLGGMSAAIAAIIWGFSQMDKTQMNVVSTSVANILLMLIIVVFILAGMRKKVNVYDAFIEGAKEGFATAVRIIPYLVAILVGIGVFRASGAMDMLIDGIKWMVAYNLPECRTDNDTHRQIHHVPAHRKFAKFFNNAHVILPMKPTTIDVGIGHDDNLVVAQLVGVCLLAVFAIHTEADTNTLDDVHHRLSLEDLMPLNLLYVQNLTTQWEDSLAETVAALLG